MKKNILLLILCCLLSIYSKAQSFNDYFTDKTLRVDYIFSGTANQQAVSVEAVSQLPSWAGKRHHLSELPLDGNGQITVNDLKSGTCIYKSSFSSLFQEWLDTDEARSVSRGFENTYLLPYPKQPVEISISFRDKKGNYNTLLKHVVKPDDILIRKQGNAHVIPYTFVFLCFLR